MSRKRPEKVGTASTPQRWAILTGEYPPQPGGVSDYTRRIATELASAGDDVEVWAPPCDSKEIADGPVKVYRLPDCFGARGLRELDRALLIGNPRRILVQYVPHAFGCRAMNIRFCHWLFGRRNRMHIWTMFHEVTYPWSLRQPPQHNLLSVVNRVMAFLLARASRRVFVSTTAWSPIVRPMLAPRVDVEPLPIPSNIATLADASNFATLRAALGTNIIGHFGSFGPHVAPMLESLLLAILRDAPQAKALLIGRGAGAFVAAMNGSLRDRLIAAENLSAQAAANHLAACDLMVQPYPDGATTRRSSLMAALALGVPVATTSGHLTEPLWNQTGAVALVPVTEDGGLARLAVTLLTDAPHRAQVAAAGRALYESQFALCHSIGRLRNSPEGIA